MLVTKSSMPTHEYSQKNQRIQIDYKQYQHKVIAVLAAVSQQIGLEHIMLFDSAININKFKVFIEELRSKFFFDDICIFMDNLNVHRSDEVQERLEELGIPCIFSPVYSPDFNPIESVFSIAKGHIKKERLRAVVHNQKIDLKKVTREAFERIDPLKITKCI